MGKTEWKRMKKKKIDLLILNKKLNYTPFRVILIKIEIKPHKLHKRIHLQFNKRMNKFPIKVHNVI